MDWRKTENWEELNIGLIKVKNTLRMCKYDHKRTNKKPSASAINIVVSEYNAWI